MEALAAGAAFSSAATASALVSPARFLDKRAVAPSSFLGDASALAARARVSGGARRLPPPGLQVVCKESRIGKNPVAVPLGVTVKLEGQNIAVKGPLGELSLVYPREIVVNQEGAVLRVAKANETRRAREMHGLFRTLTNNLVVGVSEGFEKRLQLIGVGYRAAVEKNVLVMNLGFSHPVRMPIPESITVKVEENIRLTISGRDKAAVGDFSANVRSWRPPEPYKGKGIKYSDEVIRRKEGKIGKKK